MNSAKLFQGIIVGALFSGIFSAIYACYIAFTSNTVSDFGLTTKDFWWLAMILGGIVGFVLGGIVGGIVFELNLGVILGGLIGLFIAGLPALFFLAVSNSKFDENHIRFGIALIFIETITGIIVSLAMRFILNK